MNPTAISNLVSFPRTLLLTILFAALVTAALVAASDAGWKVHGLTGHSMEPTIAPGSLLISKTVPTESLSVGDIVLFRVGWLEANSNLTAAHRITRIVQTEGGTLVYTRGDGNTVADPQPTLLTGDAVRASIAISYGEQMLQVARFGGAIAVAAFLYLLAARSASVLFDHSHAEVPATTVAK